MAGRITISTLNDDTGVLATQNGMSGIAKAWVNFNGTTSPATIGTSFNVGSVTKNGTGDYTVNFTTALPSANYSTLVSMEEDSGGDAKFLPCLKFNGRTTTSVGVEIGYSQNNLRYDSAYVAVSVFR